MNIHQEKKERRRFENVRDLHIGGDGIVMIQLGERIKP